MMMRKNIFYSLLLAVLFVSCDEIDEPFEGQTGDTSCEDVDSPFFEGNQPIDPEQLEANRRVLIMDFTGHRCAGCPAAALEASTIADDFEDEVYVLSVHPDIPSLTAPADEAEDPDDPFYTEWRTSEGDNYQDIYSIPGAIPLGVVSGKEVSGNYFTQWASWRSIVEPLIAEGREVEVEFEIDYNEDTRSIRVSGEVTFLTELENSYSVILAVVENNIEDWQKNGTSTSPADPAYSGGDIPNYVHKHVLRKHINGLGGTDLNTTSIIEGDVYSFCEAGIVDDDFNEEEVSIYAYVYDTSSLEILEVLEHHIIE